MSKVVLIDIDGTVAHRVDRDPYEYDKVLGDQPDHNIIEVATSLWKSGYKLIFLTARDDSCFKDTYEWLTKNCPPFIKLYMRKTGDYRRDSEVKKELYDTHIKSNYEVLCVLDDRQVVVDMWRKIGLTCLQVNYGDF